ncbi:hypothetical protein [Stackebrandtia soli]|uniref:hypothetical protein n=1 Tax=Stackebrandtia soli TaxID=1892856 RepID=UPI0039EAEF78
MRRIATAFGAVAAAGMFVLAAATPAAAANGTLILNGAGFENPSGCINNPRPGPGLVENYTDAPVYIYRWADCQGGAAEVVQPGEVLHTFAVSVMPEW